MHAAAPSGNPMGDGTNHVGLRYSRAPAGISGRFIYTPLGLGLSTGTFPTGFRQAQRERIEKSRFVSQQIGLPQRIDGLQLAVHLMMPEGPTVATRRALQRRAHLVNRSTILVH